MPEVRNSLAPAEADVHHLLPLVALSAEVYTFSCASAVTSAQSCWGLIMALPARIWLLVSVVTAIRHGSGESNEDGSSQNQGETARMHATIGFQLDTA